MKVTPNFHFNGSCKEALALYERAFEGKLLMLLHYRDANPEDINVESLSEEEKNFVYHAEMMIGTQRFMFSDHINEIPRGQNKSIVITFDSSADVINAFNILCVGGEVIRPVTQTTYSSCLASLVDKFGSRWELMTESR